MNIFSSMKILALLLLFSAQKKITVDKIVNTLHYCGISSVNRYIYSISACVQFPELCNSMKNTIPCY